jgi:DNA repair protein RecN (Recombination protein N)
MLKSLSITNFALIDTLEVEFNRGLNILTGETGAGKSIIINAIDIALGARASKEQIKTGKDKAVIELNFQISDAFPIDLLEDNGIDVEEDNILLISREILPNNTRSRINGVMVTQGVIQEIRKNLLDIHSQHQTYTYIQPKTHTDLLDNYGNASHKTLINKYKSLYADLNKAKKEFDELSSRNSSIEQRIDFLKFQIDEIENAQITDINEYEELIEERSVMINAETLKELTYSSYSNLYGDEGSILDVLGIIENRLIKASGYDKKLSELAEIIASSSASLKEASTELRNYSENLDIDEQKLIETEERISLLDKIKRKQGITLQDVLETLEKYRLELNDINFSSERLVELELQIKKFEKDLNEASKELSSSRKSLAESLSGLILKELVKLEMPKVKFSVNIRETSEFTTKGRDEAEFLMTTNPGEPLKPLAKIASGGEIARVMLAIKTVFAKADNVDTVIFDEIDTGISGKASQAVAEELANLSMHHQVLCITHQPIIAAMADRHFYIAKTAKNEQTEVTVTPLEKEQRTRAVSNLASGDCSDDSMNFALKLIEQGNVYKKAFLKV